MSNNLKPDYGLDNIEPLIEYYARETVHTSRLLVASVLRIVATAQAEQGDELNMAQAIADALKRLADGRHGGEAKP
ncbi:MAG: hypothetical protein ABI874_01505 [Chloroflexota bacterium]